ncbi:CDP-alcohol phosphatidyltransferase family protein [Halobellus sp. H-GB7]|uniref:CDP-alcohol phosphatidyltransferase family protein n=1 Tax=Halobellus sp. H-GB7 TaxID=3069756 RepID=UPI0027B7F85B|nr:CDP-alcohol phosphatidyltransferase family protein [Halobellus sp. H-GB7]MDQ2054369.1 CDP-alcohol phosphatidyltransferase family protein [Halobellus sp. H-GB7]
MTDARTVPAALQREWAAVAVTTVVLTAGGAAALALGIEDAAVLLAAPLAALPPAAIQWVVPASTIAGFELWFTYRHLDANRPDETAGRESVYESLGAPNLVTLARGVLFAALAGFGAVSSTPQVAWLPALLYGAGCALDFVDGFLARRTGRTTLLGAKLDMAFDTTGFLVAPVVAVLWGQLPIWYLSLSAARYLFKLGRGLRRRRGQPVYDLPDSVVRRPLAGLQMAFITLALSPLLSFALVRPLAAAVLAPSLAVFVRDYLVVSGRLPRGAIYSSVCN